MDIPFPTDVSDYTSNVSYMILFNNGAFASIPLSKMAFFIPASPVDVATCDSQDSLLPPFLQLNSKITYEHAGQYHKGYLRKPDGVFRYVSKSHVNKRKEDWGDKVDSHCLAIAMLCQLQRFTAPPPPPPNPLVTVRRALLGALPH